MPGGPSDFAPGGCAGRVPTHRLDRLDEAFPVAQRHPELFKIAFGQLRQHIKVDSVLDECWLILSESQVSQPAANVHGSALIPFHTRERTVTNPRRATQQPQREVPEPTDKREYKPSLSRVAGCARAASGHSTAASARQRDEFMSSHSLPPGSGQDIMPI